MGWYRGSGRVVRLWNMIVLSGKGGSYDIVTYEGLVIVFDVASH